MVARRTFIKAASLTAFAAGTAALSILQSHAQQAPNSTGDGAAKLKSPPNACDCHHHIYDADRFPLAPTPGLPPPTHASVSEYRLLQKRIGTTRNVVVQPRNYGIDNAVTLDALAQFKGNARGIAVVRPTVTDAELKRFDAAGVRGIRFTIGNPKNRVVEPEMIEPLAKRIADLGWHIQFNMEGHQVIELADVLRRLPVPMVFDHLGNPTLPAGIDDPSHAIIRGLIDKGRTWVKLSGAYSNSKIGPPAYPEATRTAQAFVRAAPERLVWGSDWPHPTEAENNKPNDALLFDLLSVWVPDEAVRNRILVSNPEALYGFPKTI